MDPLRKTVLRLVVYGGVIGYLLGDLFVWHGFLRSRIDRADPNTPEAIARAKAQGVVARVFNHQINRTQLDRAVAERLWREGKEWADVPPASRKMVRYAALNELIDHELLRVKAKAHAGDFPVDPEVLEQRYQRFVARFGSESEMIDVANRQGIGSKEELRERMAAWIQQEAYVESRISPLSEVTEEEMHDWWDEHKEKLEIPRRVEVRQIFLPTLDQDPDEVKKRIMAAKEDLVSGKASFEELVESVSEDPATKDQGGKLGWISEGRVDSDFTAAAFEAKPGMPFVVQTKMGWHLFEVTGRKEAEDRNYEDAKEEVRTALLAIKRDQAVREYRDALRKFEGHKIQIFGDMVE